MKTMGTMGITMVLLVLLAGCGGGGNSSGGSGSSGDAQQSKAQPRLGTPPTNGAKSLDSRSHKAGVSRDHVAYSLDQGAVDWWVLRSPTPGTTYEITLSPQSGDQDLFVSVKGQWRYSANWYLAEDSLTFTAPSSEPVYIAVYGYRSGAYRIGAYYYE